MYNVDETGVDQTIVKEMLFIYAKPMLSMFYGVAKYLILVNYSPSI